MPDKPGKKIIHGKPPKGPLQNLRMISQSEAHSLGMFREPATIVSSNRKSPLTKPRKSS